MVIQGILLVLCASALSGCVVYPAHLRFTPPPRLGVVVPVYPGGYYNAGYNSGSDHYRHYGGR